MTYTWPTVTVTIAASPTTPAKFPCWICGGYGMVWGTVGPKPCPTCKGSGQIEIPEAMR